MVLEVQQVSVETQPTRGSVHADARRFWLALGVAAVFATCRFPNAVPGLLSGFFFGGPAGAVERLTRDSLGIDWLVAFLTYPIIGAFLGGVRRLFGPASVTKWMFNTTLTLALLYLAETIWLAARHSR